MKKVILLIASLIISTSSFASLSPKASAENAERIAKILVDQKTPAEVKKLLSAVVGGQSYENRVSILSVDSDAAAGTLKTSIDIGVDDTTDDDNGWGTLYRIEVKEVRTGARGIYQIKEVKLVMVAG